MRAFEFFAITLCVIICSVDMHPHYFLLCSSSLLLFSSKIANVEPLLFKYRVNVAFYGHNHVVQRQSAVFNKTVVQHSVASTDSKVTYLSGLMVCDK